MHSMCVHHYESCVYVGRKLRVLIKTAKYYYADTTKHREAVLKFLVDHAITKNHQY